MKFVLDIYESVLYFIGLTFSTEVMWVVLPLFIATIAMITYFEKYREERPGWNTHFANSLVLLFVSIILLRYIHGIDNMGALNYATYGGKTMVSVLVLFVGLAFLFLNFRHYLPEKIARYITSPMILNLVAYFAILYVYSEIQSELSVIFALLVIFVFLLVMLNLVRILMKRLFIYLKRMKERERKEEIVHGKKLISEKKKVIKKEERVIRKAKSVVKKEEEIEKEKVLKELDKQKKDAIKLKKVVKGPLRGEGK